jgi:hypothetical protein
LGILIVFADKILYKDNSINTVKVGLVAPADSQLSKMAYSLVEEMDSYKEACEFVNIPDADTGCSMLNAEEIKALVIVPDNIIHSVMAGEDNPVRVIYNQDGSLDTYTLSAIFDSTSSMLATAQAATSALFNVAYKLNLPQESLNLLEDDINQMYMEYVLRRMDTFVKTELLATDNYSTTEYYLASGILLLLSFAGIVFISLIKDNSKTYITQLKIAGMSPFHVMASQFVSISAVLYIIYIFIYIICCISGLIWQVPDTHLSVSGFIYVIPSIMFITLVIIFVSYLPANQAGSAMILFILIFIMAYTGGGIMPQKLLPVFVEKCSHYSPFYYMLKLTARGLF